VPTADKREPEVLDLPSAKAWERWLERNAEKVPEGVWLRLTLKAAPKPRVTYPEAVEVALCYGWIDGQGKKFDDVSRLQKFTPRRARSPWSKINRGHAERLVGEGRMRPPGQAEIDRAKADGRWDGAYDPPSTAQVPEDFLVALRKYPKALAFFGTLNRTNTFAVAYRLQSAKKPETRAKRIETFVAMFERGEKFF
jgi:uncharacterized protein YdeI (YjbR/CyaY-like superfamily)